MNGAAGSGSERPADLELVRIAIKPEGAFGVILAEGLPSGLVSLERTYPEYGLDPQGPQYVKIPAGRYLCRRTQFHAGGYETYEVTGVIGHSRLLFHRGNVEADTEGCILLGQRFGFVRGSTGILESALAFAVFLRLTAGRSSFEFEVRTV